MKNLPRILPFMAVIAFLAACASNDVSCMPLPLRSKIASIYIENVPAQKVEVVLPQLVRQLSDMGFRVQVVDKGTAPEDGYILDYTVNFSKKLETLDYIKIEISHNKRVVGYVTSDASGSAAKLNSTADRLKPLLDRLFQYATPVLK
jgi:hypothetical protein